MLNLDRKWLRIFSILYFLQSPSTISSPPGTCIGYVDQSCGFCGSEIVVLNRAKEVVFRISQDMCCGGSIYTVSFYLQLKTMIIFSKYVS